MYGNVLSENANIIQALVPLGRELAGGTAVINVSLQHSITFIIQMGAGGAGTTVVTIEACDNIVPDQQTAIPFRYRRMIGGTNAWGALIVEDAAGFTTEANANDMYEITVDPAEVTNAIVNDARDNQYVRLFMASAVATPVEVGIIAILPRQAYPQETPISAIV